MTQLQNTNIYVEQVPTITLGFNINKAEHQKLAIMLPNDIGIIQLPKGKWEILGTITSEKVFDFDCADLVTNTGMYDDDYFENYLDKWKSFKNKEDSFLSLMEVSGVYFVNPKPPIKDGIIFEDGSNIEQLINWEEAELRTLKPGNKFLIFRKK